MLYRDLIRVPSVTEKNNIMRMEQNKYVFEVDPSANKIEIKKAVETIFNVKVISVNTQNIMGKMKRMGRYAGQRPSWKKAVVKLQKGASIPIFEGA
ncbi:MAG: 50S ribosomal protein L23 [Candidatus Raymondbacteria bacterium RifOxyA12_full_50_37]|uniref:Large ribosomal subunit protein uL23 n=1 Tax=Candidatus Raymondbacteria bacterium RIFOXYD12_FULL_49_13 TaxID=1817890 RepID=A0A1F7FD91_UNCRA|nr:MAG: 50S ribosomal protein L23 [Candidatus Raymondbacteria bacterium RifOxyA12_full_50_37]OGJ94056.1 MAG: 50S ribosomal protein L23 [Candidatus Raymondbacteria bacterium RIFOXYA2_FULL_49_16]OGJ96881.1 MAG: 50S ribosomal protein L23 [Candidatus Raymondbacteria bacterium RIFOXYC2_FULL_50_21]OGJ97500.1 MAG: 50S ribosomal protein L23 [Candidatus Raymondbacteria bacterium RifOxyC12_full_50_8]OGK00950.1 MAG: 50S ribosomal protein L23 [Candidatus Raymondbacteria bacterium RifOxyB12_full_50_8]OGK04